MASKTCPTTEQASNLPSKKSLSSLLLVLSFDQNKICLPVANKFHIKSQNQEWDQWMNYLDGKRITVNPLRRSQWETNLDELMLTLRLNKIGAKMKFSISNKIRTRLIDSITHRKGEKTGKDQIEIPVFTSLPGGGKTWLLLALLSLLPDFDALYYVTLGNLSESRFHPAYHHVHDSYDFQESIAMRILFSATQIQTVSRPVYFFIHGWTRYVANNWRRYTISPMP